MPGSLLGSGTTFRGRSAVDKVSGEIVSIDLINTTIKSGNEEVIVPNAELASKITRRIKKD